MSSGKRGSDEIRPYSSEMARTRTKPRPRQGERLLQLRKAAGLSQVELAQLIGESQTSVAFWEGAAKPPRSDVLPRLAEALGVSIEAILTLDERPSRPAGRPGRLRLIFEEAAKLPRGQRDRVVETVEALLEKYRREGNRQQG